MNHKTAVPFFRPEITDAEVAEVVDCLRSGWLTTGPRTKEFEGAFSRYVGAAHAVAVNSCTAALHLALEAVGLRRGDLVLVPTMSFAATAEVVRYFDAVPVFVDCDPATMCMDPVAAAQVLDAIDTGGTVAGVDPPFGAVRAIIPMHYGGQMADMDAFRCIARDLDLALIEDAAHSLPAFTRSGPDSGWRGVGTTADITCFSFYANKCITTSEGGMAVTDRPDIAERMRVMSLHGMSKDAWKRFTDMGSWYYEIVAPGFKYNMTDLAAALGLVQLRRANELWEQRCRVAEKYSDAFASVEEIELPIEHPDRRHSWHLYSIRLRLDRLTIDRAAFMEELKSRGVASSVHWMPLHMHPYYVATYGFEPGDFPVAAALWPRLVSLPIFPGMTEVEIDYVVEVIRTVTRLHRKVA
jgi:perosamine synthetase